MDIGIFSKCIKDAICNLERVAVPHLGVFQAELVPATYSDRQTTINPPYRKMSFRKCDVSAAEGRDFLMRVASATGKSFDNAEVELGWCLSRMCSELESNKVCDLPGLGKMKANARNEYFFVASPDLDIYPEGRGLEPVCIKKQPQSRSTAPEEGQIRNASQEKSHRSHNSGEYAGRNASRTEASPAVRRSDDSVPAVGQKVGAPAKAAAPRSRKAGDNRIQSKPKVWLWVLLCIFLAVLSFAVTAYLNQEDFTDLLYNILYTEEELELLGR